MDDGEDPMMAMPGDDDMLSSVQPRDDDFHVLGGDGAPQTTNCDDEFGEPPGVQSRLLLHGPMRREMSMSHGLEAYTTGTRDHRGDSGKRFVETRLIMPRIFAAGAG